MKTPKFIFRTALFSLVIITMALVNLGCNSDPELGTVNGTVLGDGQPLVDAVVIFSPDDAPASRGVTDETGHYDLIYSGERKGAQLGRHQVLVFAGKRELGHAPFKRYRLPNELQADVQAGENTFDFSLSSD